MAVSKVDVLGKTAVVVTPELWLFLPNVNPGKEVRLLARSLTRPVRCNAGAELRSGISISEQPNDYSRTVFDKDCSQEQLCLR